MWELKRKLIYALVVIVTISAVSLFLLRKTIFPEPTCFDKKLNGFEVGVDCGGTCQLKCVEEVNPLTVVWAKAIRSGTNIYDLVALVANTNINNASKELGYTFTLYGEKGEIVGTLSGSSTAPLDGRFPVIIQNVPLQKEPSNVSVVLSDGSHYTVQESPTSPTVKIVNRRYEAGDISRVYATVANTKRIVINNLPIRVILFDEKDNAYAVGQTFIPLLPKEGVQEIVVTWSEPLATPPTRIGVYPIFNPFDALGE